MPLTVDTTRSPIKVTGTTAASSAIIQATISVQFVWWLNPTSAGDLLTIVDENDRHVAPMRCQIDGEAVLLPVYAVYPGLSITDMDSGTAYIFYRWVG